MFCTLETKTISLVTTVNPMKQQNGGLKFMRSEIFPSGEALGVNYMVLFSSDFLCTEINFDTSKLILISFHEPLFEDHAFQYKMGSCILPFTPKMISAPLKTNLSS